jgi:hypothetical protein
MGQFEGSHKFEKLGPTPVAGMEDAANMKIAILNSLSSALLEVGPNYGLNAQDRTEIMAYVKKVFLDHAGKAGDDNPSVMQAIALEAADDVVEGFLGNSENVFMELSEKVRAKMPHQAN